MSTFVLLIPEIHLWVRFDYQLSDSSFLYYLPLSKFQTIYLRNCVIGDTKIGLSLLYDSTQVNLSCLFGVQNNSLAFSGIGLMSDGKYSSLPTLADSCNRDA